MLRFKHFMAQTLGGIPDVSCGPLVQALVVSIQLFSWLALSVVSHWQTRSPSPKNVKEACKNLKEGERKTKENGLYLVPSGYIHTRQLGPFYCSRTATTV